ncbi:unnamed protein product (macronuclear) [Paramecium tetraurelia]|uniref:Transmembrane protein n=1 Tax=Paramecium tetraurelia TaxID=5888 RepID=A0CL28_PARTE|nr:uncharacterized protein GSPATT00008042001 [Paramecium tetraurelia]CAK71495.1 unnamed protein product [Paramecium tetraurelia]|eukprot:XP_001438892.1 hypothetical protein (macronuclear) [Paramecium tetraurelia strain d4-2]
MSNHKSFFASLSNQVIFFSYHLASSCRFIQNTSQFSLLFHLITRLRLPYYDYHGRLEFQKHQLFCFFGKFKKRFICNQESIFHFKFNVITFIHLLLFRKTLLYKLNPTLGLALSIKLASQRRTILGFLKLPYFLCEKPLVFHERFRPADISIFFIVVRWVCTEPIQNRYTPSQFIFFPSYFFLCQTKVHNSYPTGQRRHVQSQDKLFEFPQDDGGLSKKYENSSIPKTHVKNQANEIQKGFFICFYQFKIQLSSFLIQNQSIKIKGVLFTL